MHAIAQGGVRTAQESLHWKLTLGEKSLVAPGNRTCVGGVLARSLPTELHPHLPTFPVLIVFTTFSRAVSRYMVAAMFCLVWMSSAVLYWVVSRFLARPVERKCYSVEQEDSLRPLFNAIVYLRSWVRKSVICGKNCDLTSSVTTHQNKKRFSSSNCTYTEDKENLHRARLDNAVYVF